MEIVYILMVVTWLYMSLKTKELYPPKEWTLLCNYISINLTQNKEGKKQNKIKLTWFTHPSHPQPYTLHIPQHTPKSRKHVSFKSWPHTLRKKLAKALIVVCKGFEWDYCSTTEINFGCFDSTPLDRIPEIALDSAHLVYYSTPPNLFRLPKLNKFIK